MPEHATCGKGIAANATLPERLADVVSAVADNLEAHMTALDGSDPAARAEREAYASLLTRHRAVADELRAMSEEMADYRELPPAPHDPQVMRGATLREPFERLVETERELREHLDERIAREDEMLAAAKPG